MSLYKRGDKCPKSGYWYQIETGDISWCEKGDMFPGYYQKIGLDKNGVLRVNPEEKHYVDCAEYIIRDAVKAYKEMNTQLAENTVDEKILKALFELQEAFKNCKDFNLRHC